MSVPSRLVRVAAGAPDRRAARGRHPRAAVRHPLRRPAPERPYAHVLRSADDSAARSSRTASARRASRRRCGCAPGRLPRRGRARHVPLPHVLRVGATPLGDVLDDIHEFLVTHPADVLVVVNQDYVTPPDFVAAIDDAGLDRRTCSSPRAAGGRRCGDDRRDRRLVVLAENGAGAAPWYQLAYERLTQETPFTFPAAARSSTRRRSRELPAQPRHGRGAAVPRQPLGQHRPAPRPGNADIVNAYEPLLRRARDVPSGSAGSRSTCSPSTSTRAATCSAWSTRSTAPDWMCTCAAGSDTSANPIPIGELLFDAPHSLIDKYPRRPADWSSLL